MNVDVRVEFPRGGVMMINCTVVKHWSRMQAMRA